MTEMGLAGACAEREGKQRFPIRQGLRRPVNQEFHAPEPNRLWLSDFTYVATADTIGRYADRPEVVRTSAALLERGLKHLRDVARVILDQNRLDNTAVPLRPEDINDIRLLVTPEIERQGQLLEWTVQPEAFQLVDLPAAKMRQIALNLLINASTAAGRGGMVALNVRCGAGTLDIALVDNGPGMPQARFGGPLRGPPVGRRRSRASDRARARRRARWEHRARATRRQDSDHRAPAARARRRGRLMLEGRRILLVEDDEIMGASIAQRLEIEGAAVQWVKQVVRAIPAVRTPRAPIDAVICDIRLPDGTGEEIFSRLTSTMTPPPFLFITGQGGNRAGSPPDARGGGGLRHKALRHGRVPGEPRAADAATGVDPDAADPRDLARGTADRCAGRSRGG